MKYIHEVRYIETDELFDIIETKKVFKEEMIKYFFENEDPKPLYFKLINSLNKKSYKVIPYINKKGNPSIVFTIYHAPEKDKKKLNFETSEEDIEIF